MERYKQEFRVPDKALPFPAGLIVRGSWRDQYLNAVTYMVDRTGGNGWVGSFRERTVGQPSQPGSDRVGLHCNGRGGTMPTNEATASPTLLNYRIDW